LSVFFYISGHGFGHAIRQIEIINIVSALVPDAEIVIRTTAPRWLFERTARARYTFIDGSVDTGVIQHDSLTLDEEETVRRAAAFYEDIDRLARREEDLLRHHRAELVLADAPPLACAAARRAKIPSIVCANFTWDWIYASYEEWLPSAPNLIDSIRSAYANATEGWRLPMHGGFDSVPNVVDLPFVARQPRFGGTRDDLRRMLGLPRDKRLALVSFGGYGLEGLPLDRLDCFPAWDIVVTGVTKLQSALVMDEAAIYAAGLGYQDVVRAVDVVITKPGYGIISDCMANGTAMLYTARGRFAEYEVLVREMPRFLRCRFIDAVDLREGRWREALDQLIESPPPPEPPRMDGGLFVGEKIKAMLDRRPNS
jgi:L-arabinokinase